MLTNAQKRAKAQKKLYEAILKSLNLKRVISKYGVQSTRWALNRYVTGERTKQTLLNKKQALEKELAELDKKM